MNRKHPKFFLTSSARQLNLVLLWRPLWFTSWVIGYNSERESPSDGSPQVWFQLSKWFETRIFSSEFPLWSYVKLSSPVAVILVGEVVGYNSERGSPKDIPSKFDINWLDIFLKKPIPIFLFFIKNTHVCWSIATPDIILSGDQPGIIPSKSG